MARSMTVRADEVHLGDVAAVKGLVGAVVDRHEHDRIVELTVETTWGARGYDVFDLDTPVVIERH